MKTSIVLTVIANDHPGIINTVSEVLYEHGGAWTESSMASLAGQFAGILLASVDSEAAEACVKELQGLESQGLHVMVQLGEAPVEKGATREYVLDLVGNDRRGIVHDITTVLARFDVVGQLHPAGNRRRALHLHHRLGALGTGRAGHHRHTLSGLELVRRRRPGRHLPHLGHHRTRVVEAHGETVAFGAVERRGVAVGEDGLAQTAAQGLDG